MMFLKLPPTSTLFAFSGFVFLDLLARYVSKVIAAENRGKSKYGRYLACVATVGKNYIY